MRSGVRVPPRRFFGRRTLEQISGAQAAKRLEGVCGARRTHLADPRAPAGFDGLGGPRGPSRVPRRSVKLASPHGRCPPGEPTLWQRRDSRSFGKSESHKIKINSNRTSEAQRSIAATNNQPCGPSTTRPHTQPGLDLPLSSLRLLTFLECALPAPFSCFLVGPPALRPACPPARLRPCLPW